MENKKWDNCRRSQKGKPPRGIWRPAVPSWEKKFCKEIGSMKWEALIKAKKDIHLYSNVMNWDDSAAKEAFFDAKNRYWAQINGLPCDDIPLPDPDLYIDKDINSDNDAEKTYSSSSSSTSHHRHHHAADPVIIFGDSFLPPHHQTTAYHCGIGWGDDFKAADAQPNQVSNPNYAAAVKGNDPTSTASHGFISRRYQSLGWRNKLVLGRGKTTLREGNPQVTDRSDVRKLN